MNITPYNKFYLIEKIEISKTTSSGIFLTDDAVSSNENFYKVLKAWPNTENAVPGDTIVIGKHVGDDITVDGKDYKIIGDHNILATIS